MCCLFILICVSCNKNSEFRTEITKGYWFFYDDPKRQINNPKRLPHSSCEKFDTDGIWKSYYFKEDGSVDTTDNKRSTEFDVEWDYSANDSVFRFGKKVFYYFKFVKIIGDTIILKAIGDLDYKKDKIIYLVKYTPKSVPILVGDSIIRWK
jgi:hypothetical protein